MTKRLSDEHIANIRAVRAWDGSRTTPLLITRFDDTRAHLYLPPESVPAEVIFSLITGTTKAQNAPFKPEGHPRYVSFSKSNMRKRVEVALGMLFPAFVTEKTRQGEICNVKCRLAFDIECECRCDDTLHQIDTWPDFRIVEHSNSVLVLNEADDLGVITEERIVQGTAQVVPAPTGLAAEYARTHEEDVSMWEAYETYLAEVSAQYAQPVQDKVTALLAERKSSITNAKA